MPTTEPTTAVVGIPEKTHVAGWRIEITRRKLRSGKYGLYWLWRITRSDGSRPSKYGGRVETLPHPARLKQYKRNSRRYARRLSHE